ncbi:kinase-like domain-containing protein [Mycotypha africana]|uniref:kinase-like domain-containing protein n=1 Tax=Mycotypha africana TaxID=64632 RepID=UPI00230146ED|nr:kinase-like domain-containing protein [Mycotypha africana]KAI8967712.1 kinase-like domain-containing protein [Mycotypha africana]
MSAGKGRFNNRIKAAGLKIQLTPPVVTEEDTDQPPQFQPPSFLSEHNGSRRNSTKTSEINWREDIVRIVRHQRSCNDISSLAAAATATTSETQEVNDMSSEDFENLKKLGEGAAGTVWQVKHKPTNRVMAKKTITVDPDPQLQRQILRELSFLKTCQSPHIVSFYGAFLDDGDTTIVLCMEYCEGGSLEDIYKRAHQINGIIGETILANIAESVCRGLIYLHEQHVIHRDIKPSNILMTRKGRIKLCDLGVSGELINSLAQTFTGTQYYMAPERIQGATYSVTSDIWSLGLTIIEVAQNRPALPPPGQPHLSIFELLDYIVRQPMPTVGQDRSIECQQFVETCLIKEPEKRPTPEQMLKHEFIQLKADQTCDMEGWLKELWGWA